MSTELNLAEKKIVALASSNPKPILSKSDPTVRPQFSPNFSLEEEERVRLAIEELLKESSTAIPQLVKQSTDDRYSVTREDANGSWSNWTIGDVCRFILKESVEPLRHLIRRDNQRNVSLIRSSQDIEKWWQQRKQRHLYELQFEWLKSALVAEIATPFESDSEERKVIGTLSKSIADICESQKPLVISHQFLLRPK